MYFDEDNPDTTEYPPELEHTHALPKWAGFMVWGESVTKEQAEEIILRTTRLDLSSNSPQTEKMLYDVMGISYTTQEKGRRPWADYESVRATQDRIDSLVDRLEYLSNSNILSAYVGGPGGWVDWEGNVGCKDRNIGKRACCHDAYREWSLIAEAFPYLDLTCHLYNGEHSEWRAKPVIEYRIKDGKVTVRNAPERVNPDVRSRAGNILSIALVPAHVRELGIPIQEFKRVWERVTSRFEAPPMERVADLHPRFIDLEFD
jgi:hypothetical protein